MQGPDGVISEAYTIGNWGWSWTEIVSKQLTLPKNTLHTFTFWLNGGENDRSDEVCRLEIFFNNDYDGRYTYNLNRSFIKPIKRCNGWELYEIPFRTGDNEYTQLKFIAQRAYMTVLTAQDVSSYKDLPESIDKFANIRPQRHNIIFGDDGWPTNTWYSTRKLEEQDKQQNNAGSLDSMSPPHNVPFNADIDSVRSGVEALRAQIAAMTGMDISSMAESIRQTIKESILSAGGDESDVEDIVSDAIESLEDSITDATEELSDRLEELSERLEELSEE